MAWAGVGGGLLLAAVAGWREAARKRRFDLDAVGLIAWPTVQVLALMLAAICGWLLYRS